MRNTGAAVCPVFIGVLTLVTGCSPRASTLPIQDEKFLSLKKFVLEDPFVPNEGSFYPVPVRAPGDLLRYARENYDSDPRVRALLAIYFLRYDSVLLDKGLVTVGGVDDLINNVLWEKEGYLDGMLGETPSAWLMRDRIDRLRKERFHLDVFLDGLGLRLLEETKKKRDQLEKLWGNDENQ